MATHYPCSQCSLKVSHERNSFQTWAKQHRWRPACPLPQSVRGRSYGRIRGNEHGLAHVHSTQYLKWQVRLKPERNWVDSKQSVNSVDSSISAEDNAEPRQRSMREGVETRHGSTYKICSVCNEPKGLDDFYGRKDSGKSRPQCKRCVINAIRERTLGITSDEYWDLYHKQDGQCGICLRRLYSKRYKAFCVDHNHATGVIRGLLCHNCNRALGMYRDDPATLRRAAEWVEGIVQPHSNVRKSGSSSL